MGACPISIRIFTVKKNIVKFLDFSNLLLISGIFLFAGIMKLVNFGDFPEEIARYHVLPESLILYAALYLVFFEIFVAIAILIPKFRVNGAFCVFFLMMLFCLAIIYAMIRGIDVTCGCFGSNGSAFLSNGFAFLFRDIILLLMSIRLIYFTLSLETPTKS